MQGLLLYFQFWPFNIKTTRNEEGCLYYGWTICDDKLFCREAYIDGNAVNIHLKNVCPLINEFLESAGKLDSIDIMGPSKEIEVVREGTEGFGTKYYKVHSGFTNFTNCNGGTL